jgi:3',5'-cyclic AMP phosphodiesterase CpdA
MSDLHLEFGALNRPMPDGDVLILAGDITLTGIYDPDSQLYGHKRFIERTEVFLDQCRERFKRIYFLIGNHEAYNSNLSITSTLIRKNLKGVTLLENKAVDLGDDVILVGGTLWTDMNEGRDAWQIGRAMNDFQCIVIKDKHGTRTFRPEDAMAKFAKTKRFIAKTAKANPGKTIVVATHHAPSIKGLDPQHVRFSRINAGYYTDLHAFIESLPNIKWWLHGHTHLQKRYRISQCQVISNARGYIGQEDSADAFNPDCWFDPVTGKQNQRWRRDAEAVEAAE